jgi:hypothetical protein
MPFNTAFDFRGRLRFPRVTREPPRRCAPAGRKAEAARSAPTSIR